jgi:hypothetical protein
MTHPHFHKNPGYHYKNSNCSCQGEPLIDTN